MARAFVMMLLLLLALVGLNGPVYSHGERPHILGTISAADADHLEVRTPEGNLVTVRLDSHTKYFGGKTPATSSDLKTGLRVVVHVRGDAKEPTAAEVRLPPDKAKEAGQE